MPSKCRYLSARELQCFLHDIDIVNVNKTFHYVSASFLLVLMIYIVLKDNFAEEIALFNTYTR